MYIITTLICIGVALLISNGAYKAIFKSEPARSNTSDLSPEEHLKRVYRSAYFADVSLAHEASENIEEDSNDY